MVPAVGHRTGSSPPNLVGSAAADTPSCPNVCATYHCLKAARLSCLCSFLAAAAAALPPAMVPEGCNVGFLHSSRCCISSVYSKLYCRPVSLDLEPPTSDKLKQATNTTAHNIAETEARSTEAPSRSVLDSTTSRAALFRTASRVQAMLIMW